MTRRGLLLGLFATPQRDELADRWNAFADIANLWARKRNEGIIDLENMRKSETLWARLIKCEGWPRG